MLRFFIQIAASYFFFFFATFFLATFFLATFFFAATAFTSFAPPAPIRGGNWPTRLPPHGARRAFAMRTTRALTTRVHRVHEDREALSRLIRKSDRSSGARVGTYVE